MTRASNPRSRTRQHAAALEVLSEKSRDRSWSRDYQTVFLAEREMLIAHAPVGLTCADCGKNWPCVVAQMCLATASARGMPRHWL